MQCKWTTRADQYKLIDYSVSKPDVVSRSACTLYESCQANHLLLSRSVRLRALTFHKLKMINESRQAHVNLIPRLFNSRAT